MEVGVDIVEIDRIERAYARYGMQFLHRFLSDREIEACLRKPSVVASLAGRFAAKEAVVKALGTGIARGVHWKRFEILNDTHGRPAVHHDATLLPEGSVLRISISHDRHSAVAMAVLEERPA